MRMGRGPAVGRSSELRPVVLVLSRLRRAMDGNALSSLDHVPLPSCRDDVMDSADVDPAPPAAPVDVRLIGSVTLPGRGL